ncbi:MAG: STAS-like domain-containing protein [Aestuariivita sp.]|nr:STAS-like domain-containing protein [Aestuariivita sp.]
MNTGVTKRIVIATDFSPYPAGRFIDDGEFNGTTFRIDYLAPALREFDRVEVVFDGVAGFGSSFLEEAFGGLIREEGIDLEDLNEKLILSTTEPDLKDDVQLTKKYMKLAAAARK